MIDKVFKKSTVPETKNLMQMSLCTVIFHIHFHRMFLPPFVCLEFVSGCLLEKQGFITPAPSEKSSEKELY